ncbi:RNA pseudouridylate synthase domain-containing protein 2-like [Gigantopelta aegis]|uniref:RNA pseudouridylate synthase domain-containing protein 2-like n=1 Tax=Gigantopelta aegis TaxID=1735272 RepID=UPI001B8884B6|nr:RNA pseudouridylate synthase domain-containing protein 2-like [Gigantopelta aegis]XP_041375382.1 RNA pseudouridylate synthase domain-containing protein 2-like [Gigantopelta aegis]
MLYQRCLIFISERLLKVGRFFTRPARKMASAYISDPGVELEDTCHQTSVESQNKDYLSKRARKRLEKLRKYKEMKKTKKSSTKNTSPGFSADFYKETEYYFENGLRKVYPYYYTFTTYAKFRWQNRTILDVLATEFRANSEQDYKKAIENGTVTVNGQTVAPDYKLKNNDLIANKVHRHENPVLATPIEVIAHDDDILVINKPSSIPCHPCGQYRHNSIVFILGKELGCANLTNIYRLDRLTSGVLIMGKSRKKTRELEDQIVQRKVQKQYVSRVVGNFPDGIVEVKEPLGCLSEKVGLFRTKAGGKESHTSFEKLSFNGQSSVVKCIPYTGRTHQIRIHLQFLGHPIVNDPFYNSEAWGKERGKGGVYDHSEEEIAKKIMEKHYLGLWEDGENPFFHERLQEIKDTAQNTEDAQTPVEDLQGHQKMEADKLKSDDNEPCCKKLCIDDSVSNELDSNCLSDVPVHSGNNFNTTESSDANVESYTKHNSSDLNKISVQSNSKGDFSDHSEVSVQSNAKGESYIRTHVHEESSSKVDSSLGIDVHVDSGTQEDISDSNNITGESDTKRDLSEASDMQMKSSTKSDLSVGSDAVVESSTSDKLSITNPSKRCSNDRPGFDRWKWIPDVNCDRCKKKYTNPSPEEMMLYLHALKYKGPNWEYTTDLPEWAKDDWKEA